MLIPHQHTHIHTCTLYLPLSYKTASVHIPDRQTHTLTNRCCLVGVPFIMLLFRLALHFICTVPCKLLSAAKIMNSLERTHILSFSSVLSLGFFRFYFPLFSLLWHFLPRYLLLPIILSTPFYWKNVLMNVTRNCMSAFVLCNFLSFFVWFPMTLTIIYVCICGYTL